MHIPHPNDLSVILQNFDYLARIDRYLSSLEEQASFFFAIFEMLETETAVTRSSLSRFKLEQEKQRVGARAKMVAWRTRDKILRQKGLCQTYIKQFETLIQMVSLCEGFANPQ